MNPAVTETPPRALDRAFWADLFSRLVAFSLPVTYFLVTVSFFLRTYDSAQIKITFAQVGCTLTILFWFLQLLFQGRWPFSKKDLVIVAPFLAVLLSGVVSFAQASFPAGSLDEFIRRVLYAFMALIVIAEFRGMDRRHRLLRWLMAAFGVTVFYGFVQFFDGRLFPPGQGAIGLDPFIWRQAFSHRVFSSFGNPNFYGNFLVIVTPILLSVYFRNGGKVLRPFMALACLLAVAVLADKLLLGSFGGVTAQNRLWVIFGVLAALGGMITLVFWRHPSAAASGMLLFFGATFLNIYATETKGAWVGFVAAMAFTAILAGLFLIGRRARRLTYGLLVATAIVVGGGAWAVIHYAQARKQSVDFRVFTWISTWDMIRTQPWLGTGIGTFKWAYPAFRRPEIILLEGRSNTETDHAEDEYLEIWYDEGLIGLGVFLWMVLTVSVLGVRALFTFTGTGNRGPPGEETVTDERVYTTIGYLGAWWGALVHWFFDVSVRFVSSGIYSLLLPGLVASIVRNNPAPDVQDLPAPKDRWIRLGIVVFWGAALCHWIFGTPSTRAQPWGLLIGILICCAAVWGIGEILEWRLIPAKARAAQPTVLPAPVAPWRWGVAALLIAVWALCYRDFRNYFIADVNHNIAIFFSKQNIWAKSPEFDAKIQAPGYPPEMRREYEEKGGALDHYEIVCRLNPGFPMARYFIGNVYNDWGSGVFEQAKAALDRGDAAEAARLRAEAGALWAKSLAAYDLVKDFAPNYVQTHHQVGLLYLKKAEMEVAFQNKDAAMGLWNKALENFALYNKLDPVFPPNYYRESYIHFTLGDVQKAEAAYLGALKYNKENVVDRVYHDRNVETYSNLGRLFYIRTVNAHPGNGRLPAESPDFQKALEYYRLAVEEAKASYSPETYGMEPGKALAVLYARAGLMQRSGEVWHQLRQWNPRDPDVIRAFSPPGS